MNISCTWTKLNVWGRLLHISAPFSDILVEGYSFLAAHRRSDVFFSSVEARLTFGLRNKTSRRVLWLQRHVFSFFRVSSSSNMIEATWLITLKEKKNRLKTETLTCFRLLNVTICCFSPWYFTVGWISFGVSGLRKVLISSLQTNLVFSSPQWKLGWHLRCHSVLWEVCEGHTDFCNYTQQ